MEGTVGILFEWIVNTIQLMIYESFTNDVHGNVVWVVRRKCVNNVKKVVGKAWTGGKGCLKILEKCRRRLRMFHNVNKI